MKVRAFLALAFIAIIVFSYTFHGIEFKITMFNSLMRHLEPDQVATDVDTWSGTKDGNAYRTWIEQGEKEEEVKSILAKLDQLMPSVTFTHMNTTTSAKNSKATILNHKDSYCVGEHLMVRLDLYDHLGKRKEYGGDFLRARIYSSSLKAAASGLIKDYSNGTYLVNFTLFWEGNARVSLLLIHSSEAVSALWAARKKGYAKIGFIGKFLNGKSTVSTQCGFDITTTAELCEYLDKRDQEGFYCVKPKNVSCNAFISLKSYNAATSYLTDLERSLVKRSNIGVEIPHTFGDIRIVPCESNKMMSSGRCRFRINSPFPSGFALQNQWHPLFCNMADFTNLDQIYTCLKGKIVYLLGDSTTRQWIEYLTKIARTFKYLDSHGVGAQRNLIAVDMDRNIQIQWRKHNHPFITVYEYLTRDHNYIAREIDNIAGDKNTAVVIALGQHFRPFPMEFFIQRLINIRKAIQRLLLRSPDTRVIIKGENIRELDIDQERFSDFHGYAQNLATKDVFWDMDVGFVDAWDMTIAYTTPNVHPPRHVIGNQIQMFLNYIC